MLVDIANEQYSSHNEVGIIVVNNYSDQSVKERINAGVKLFELNRTRSSKRILPFIKLLLILRVRFKADVIHIHDPDIGRLVRLFCRIPLVLTVHNTNMDPRKMGKYSKIFAISEAVKMDIESRSRLNCKVIYNGIKLHDIKKRDQFIAPETYKIILVKRLDHQPKGQDILINAINFLIRKKGRITYSFLCQ